jgi:hypothetical protein
MGEMHSVITTFVKIVESCRDCVPEFSRVLRTSDFVPCLFLTEPNPPVCHMFLEVTFVAVRFDRVFSSELRAVMG